jgi:hypothetical protein
MKTFCPISFFFQSHGEQLAVLASRENHGPLDSVTAFFRNLLNCREGRSEPVENNLLDSSLSNMSSITTSNGPWVYTVVPWED